MSRFGTVEYEVTGGIAIMTMDEEARLNALSAEIKEGLSKGFDEVERDDDVWLVILTGKGRSFCAGADIRGLHLESPVAVKKFMHQVLVDTLSRAERVSKPVIAAVNGLALGGGLELAIGCDIIIASDKAQFGVPEARLGLVPGFAIVRLHELVGRHKAKELILTTETISAEEALRIGLVNKVVPHDKLMEEAIALSKKIMENPKLTIWFAKSAVNRQIYTGGDEIAYAIDAMPYLFSTQDAQEGITAFLEKRKPSFKGR